jgi:hypothetical protein
MQYVPEDWVYTYFRYDNNQTVMVMMNTAAEEKTVEVSRFSERTNGFRRARNIVTSSAHEFSNNSWKIPAKTIWILNLER